MRARFPSRPALIPLVAAGALLLPALAPAQMRITARVAGDDVVIEDAGGGAPCAGDLYRGTDPSRPPFDLIATGITCPYTVVDDGRLAGAEGGVYYYLADPGAPWFPTSNMAVRYERHLDVEPLPDNTSLVSLPMIRSLPDLANTAAPESNKCVGDPGGPSAPDGLVNADDLLCAWWSSRTTGQGSMMVSRLDVPTQTWLERTAFIDPASGNVEFSGAWIDEITDVTEGYLATVTGAIGTSNQFLIAGSHEPAWTGRVLAPVGTGTNMVLLSVPFHAMYVEGDELPCGLDGVDWADNNPMDGCPDTCDGGIFDGEHAIAVGVRDSVADGGFTDGTWVVRMVTRSLGRLVFVGQDYDIPPGNAFLASLTPDHVPTTYIVPHY